MLLQWIFFISLLLSYLTSDKLMGFDGRYGSKICINCFTLNHLCSMWSSTDWFPPFKQAFHTAARWKDTALIFGLFHSLNCGDSPEEVTPPHLPTAAPGLTAQSLDTGERSARAADTTPWHRQGWLVLPLYSGTAGSAECVYTTTTSCPSVFLCPTCLASLHSSEGRQVHSQGAAIQLGTCFYLGKSHSEKFTELKISIVILFLLVCSGILL